MTVQDNWTISVIIPTYNRADLLKRALTSVLSQSQQPTEVIVVDDGSTDNTTEVIKKYASQVQYFQIDNSGISAARNYGISKAIGNWIAFLDSDDEWLLTKLEKQINALNNSKTENNHYQICHTEEIWIRNGKRVNQMKKHQKYGGWIYEKCLPLCCISPSSVMIHKNVFKDVGVFDENLAVCEDYDLWLRICAKYPVLFLDKPQIKKYGGHQDQLSRKYWGMDRFRIIALQKMLNTDSLSAKNRLKTIEMLLKKARILLKGAYKHKNPSLIKEMEFVISKYDATGSIQTGSEKF